ncbi:MAG: hypothetical protein IBX56_03415 [Methylomicrobium sp.]|nr:hypothetical protein [Methylomicrobium sp.]
MTEHCYSTDPDCYYYPADSEADAHAKAQRELNDRRELGSEQTYWIAEQVHPIDIIINQPRTLAWIGDNILEEIQEAIFGELPNDGEHFQMTPEQTLELVQVALDFIRKHAIVKYFGVRNEREFKHKTPDSAQYD